MSHRQIVITDAYRPKSDAKRRIVRENDMGKYLWLAVEIDEYELPLYVADSARELAEKFGTTKHNVECNVLRGDNGRISGRRFIRVLNDG